MSVVGVAVPLAVTAVAVQGVDNDGLAGESLLLTNSGGGIAYLGGSNVTSTIGTPVAVGAQVPIRLNAGETLYACVASGTGELRVLRIGV